MLGLNIHLRFLFSVLISWSRISFTLFKSVLNSLIAQSSVFKELQKKWNFLFNLRKKMFFSISLYLNWLSNELFSSFQAVTFPSIPSILLLQLFPSSLTSFNSFPRAFLVSRNPASRSFNRFCRCSFSWISSLSLVLIPIFSPASVFQRCRRTFLKNNFLKIKFLKKIKKIIDF